VKGKEGVEVKRGGRRTGDEALGLLVGARWGDGREEEMR